MTIVNEKSAIMKGSVYMSKLGHNIKNRREFIGLEQTELAERVKTTQAMISYIENGSKIPSVALLTAIADVLGSSVDELLGRNNTA